MQQQEADAIKLMEADLMAYYTNNLTRKATSDLIYGGLVIQDISGFWNLTQLECSKKVLEVFQQNETRINETFGPFLSCDGFPISPINVLRSLVVLVPKLPHDSTARHDVTFYIVSSCLAGIVLLMRLYVRAFKAPRKLHVEDWLATASMVFNVCCAICLHITPSTHVYDFTYKALQKWGITIYTAYQMFFIGSILIKMSFLSFYYRLNPDKVYRKSVIVIAILVIMLSLTAWLITALQCIPANSMWLHPFKFNEKVRECRPDKKCIHRVIAFILAGAFLIVCDFMILILPIPMVWKMLNLHRREKCAISCMFLAGSIITLFSVLRVRTLKPWLTSNDFPSKVSGQEVFMVMELDISVIINCFPALKPILFPKRKPSDVILSFLTFAANGFGARPKMRRSARSYGLATTVNQSQMHPEETGDFHQTAATSATIASVGARRGKEGEKAYNTIHSVGPKDEHKDYRHHDPYLWDWQREPKLPEHTEEEAGPENGESSRREREMSNGTFETGDSIEPVQESLESSPPATQLRPPSAAHMRYGSQPRPRRDSEMV